MINYFAFQIADYARKLVPGKFEMPSRCGLPKLKIKFFAARVGSFKNASSSRAHFVPRRALSLSFLSSIVFTILNTSHVRVWDLLTKSESDLEAERVVTESTEGVVSLEKE